MKKLILILTLIFTTSLYSQYNLVFNRVVNEQLDQNQQHLTVPDGKVWKIQGFFNNGTGNTNSPSHYPFSITKPDGTYLSYGYSSNQNQTIWASEGEKITMAGSLPNSSNRIAVNALEFNLSSATSSGGGSGDSGSGGSEVVALVLEHQQALHLVIMLEFLVMILLIKTEILMAQQILME